MNRILVAVLAVVTVGCGSQAEDFRKGLPTNEMVKTTTPEDANTPAGVKQQMSIQGERADAYKLTRGATVFVNGATVAVLTLIHRITQYEPTSIDKNSATWGPHHDTNNDGLGGSKNEWKLTVQRVAANDFSYVLEARAYGTDAAFVPVLSGSHTKGTEARYGKGSFLIDWDNAQTLPQNDGNVGTAQVTYSRFNAQDEVSVDVVFTQVHNNDTVDTTDRIDAAYKYRHTPGAGGTFDFRANRADGAQWNIRSRWLQTGEGRSDVKATSGGGIVLGTLAECWDATYASRFQFYSWDASKNYGTVAADCASAFQDAEYSTL